MKAIAKIVSKIEDKKWVIAMIAAGIAVAAAVISVIVYFGNKEEKQAEDDIFAE